MVPGTVHLQSHDDREAQDRNRPYGTRKADTPEIIMDHI